MCFKFTLQPDPPFPVLKRIFFFPQLPMSCQFHWAVSAPRLHKPNYVHFYRACPPLTSIPGKCDSVYKRLKGVSSQPPCMSYTRVGDLFLTPHQRRAASQINRQAIALQQGLLGTRNYQTAWVHLCFLPAYDYQPDISPEMAETRSISNDFKRTTLSSHTWGYCQLHRRREATFWNVTVKCNCKIKSNLNVLLGENH